MLMMRPPSRDARRRPRFPRTQEAARFPGLSPRAIEKHRTYGIGPAYRETGGRVVYAVHDLIAWTKTGMRTATADVVPGAPRPAKPDEACRLARM